MRIVRGATGLTGQAGPVDSGGFPQAGGLPGTSGFPLTMVSDVEHVDVLVVAAPGGPQTRHLVNEAVLQALGPQGIVVNVARGSVIDETALMACLGDGRLGGAGLDVFENEPQVPAALQAMEQVVLAPHMASGTRETRQAMADMTLANLAAGLAGLALVARA